jgi:hypothetical protein
MTDALWREVKARLGAAAALGYRQQDTHELLRHFFQVPGIPIGALHHRQSPREGDRKVCGNVGIATERSPRGRCRKRVTNQCGEIFEQPLDPGLDCLAGERQFDRRLGSQGVATR